MDRRSYTILLYILAIPMCVLQSACVASESSVLREVKTYSICEEGSGPWDVRIRMAGGKVIGFPRGQAIDNDGRLFINDTFQHRVFCFDPEREFIQRIPVGENYKPNNVSVKDGKLFVWNSYSRGAYVLLTFEERDKDWVLVDEWEVPCPGVNWDEVGHYILQPHPDIENRYIEIHPMERKPGHRILDRNGEVVGRIPSLIRDKENRYYRMGLWERAVELGVPEEGGFVEILNASSEIVAETILPFRPALLRAYKGSVYAVRHEDGHVTMERFSDEGEILETIDLEEKAYPGWILISPDTERLFLRPRSEENGIFQLRECEYVPN